MSDAVEQFDLIVIGSGQGGNPLAVAFAKEGKRAVVIERAQVGGSCINYGCTPTKTMAASAQRAHIARSSADFGVLADNVRVDMERVRAKKRATVEEFRSRSEKRFDPGGPELLRGEARFVGPKKIAVALREDGAERQLTAEVIVVDTGTRAAVPPIPGLDGSKGATVPFLDNISVMELGELPQHLIILGGGYIGVEFGQMFRRFGSQVTLLQHASRILPREDEEISGALTSILQDGGMVIRTGTEVTRVEGRAGQIRVAAADGSMIDGSHLLVATGRTPNTEALDLAKAGLAPDKDGHLPVNETLETRAQGIYAVGDVKGGPAFTHISYDDYRILRDNLLHGASRSTKGRLVPYVVYTEPQLGRVGMSEHQARKSGRAIKVAKMPMSSVARASETGETQGLMKVIVDAESELILGAAVLGAEGGEIMSMLELAMLGQLKYGALVEAILAHPTYAESLNNVFSHWADEKG